MQKGEKIFLAGHNGMVGSAIKRKLESEGFQNLICTSSSELDLRNQKLVDSFFNEKKPEYVINAAARVGGILANDKYPWQFLYENLAIQNNLISSAHNHNVSKFIFLGSSCIYPKFSDQPIKENYLLDGALEPTNEWYAIAKIAGLKMIEALRQQYDRDYVSLMPTNLYGPNDNFDLETSHVLPALIRKFHEAKETGNKPVTLWGTGSPKREFLHVDDIASAVLFSLENDLKHPFYNIGTGKDIAIKDLALLIQSIVGHKGEIKWDTSKPDGTPRKLLDVSKMKSAGWSYNIELRDGIEHTYKWFMDNLKKIREVEIKN